jgi:SAM-dependent methyltransferase
MQLSGGGDRPHCQVRRSGSHSDCALRLAERMEFRQANALDLPFQDGTFDHVWSYAVTMNIADKEGLGREVARVLKPGGRFSCNEIARGSGGTPVFPLPWADDEVSSFLVSAAEMCAALEAGGLSVIEHVDLTATRLGETGRQPVIEHDDFPCASTTFRAAWPMGV